MSDRSTDQKPAPAAAFYALEPGGWRDYVTLLHLPYTAWHLAYVVAGGCLAATVAWGRLGLTVIAFFLALGIAAHALDELHGRPLRTSIPARILVLLAVVSVSLAATIGIVVSRSATLWLLPLIAIGAFLVPAYNLEWFGGRIHNDLGFALAWGAFPVITSYLAQAGAIHPEAMVAATWAVLLSLAQRALSTPVRHLRREVRDVDGWLLLDTGGREQLDRTSMIRPLERALRLLGGSVVAAAGMLAVLHL